MLEKHHFKVSNPAPATQLIKKPANVFAGVFVYGESATGVGCGAAPATEKLGPSRPLHQ